LKINVESLLDFYAIAIVVKVLKKYILTLKNYKESALDILYPKETVCAVCENKLDKNASMCICEKCMELLPFIKGHFCEKCGKPKRSEGESCKECYGEKIHFEQAVSVFEYTASIQRLIHRFKYKGERYLSHCLGGFLAKKLKEQRNWDYSGIVAVPLHKKRQCERGFNQSELLSQVLAERVEVPVLSDTLIRIKETSVQAGLGRQERFANLKQAFHIRDKEGIIGKRIVLVDDIFTTGSTVNECSRVLIEAGAEKVYVLTVATGRPQ